MEKPDYSQVNMYMEIEAVIFEPITETDIKDVERGLKKNHCTVYVGNICCDIERCKDYGCVCSGMD